MSHSDLICVYRFDYTLSVHNREYIKCVVQTDTSQVYVPAVHIF